MTKDYVVINGKEVIAESMAYRIVEKSLQACIEDPEVGDPEVKLADAFLCTLREAKKKALENLDKKEAKK